MTWRRLTRAEHRAEALAEYRNWLRDETESRELLRQLLEEDDARREAGLAVTKPMLAGMSSAQILEALHAALSDGSSTLPCHQHDVLSAVLEELDRRRDASAHERMRLRDLDRQG